MFFLRMTIPTAVFLFLTFSIGAGWFTILDIDVMVFVPIALLFYWTVEYPLVFPALLLFALGLLTDAIHAFPLGCHALLYLLMRGLLLINRRRILEQTFPIRWLIFLIFISAYALMYYGILNMYLGYLGGAMLFNIIVQALATAMLYPILHQLMEQLKSPMGIILDLTGGRS